MLTHNTVAVPDLDDLLSIDVETIVCQLNNQRADIDAFDEARAERGMDKPGGFKDAVDKTIVGLHATAIAIESPKSGDALETAKLTSLLSKPILRNLDHSENQHSAIATRRIGTSFCIQHYK